MKLLFIGMAIAAIYGMRAPIPYSYHIAENS